MSQATNLIRLESNDPRIAGFLITYPSSVTQEISWKYEHKVTDTLKEAKAIASQLVQTLIDAQQMDDLQRTNWASVTAAIQRIIQDFNDRLPDVSRETSVH